MIPNLILNKSFKPMTLSVSSVRKDKLKSPGKGVKCGGGYISQGETCGGKKKKKVGTGSKIAAGLTGAEAVLRTVQGANNIRKGNLAMGGAQLGNAVGAGLASRAFSKGQNKKGALHYFGTGTVAAGIGGGAGAFAKRYKTASAAFNDLGVKPNASVDDIKAAYKAASRKAHPDMGGSAEAQQKVNNAYTEAMKMKRGGKFKKDGKSVWAAGSKVTDGENFWEM